MCRPCHCQGMNLLRACSLQPREVQVHEGFRCPNTLEAFKRCAVQVACGARHSCAVTEQGALLAWGWNLHGQCGVGQVADTITSPQPVPLPPHVRCTGVSRAELVLLDRVTSWLPGCPASSSDVGAAFRICVSRRALSPACARTSRHLPWRPSELFFLP